MSEDSKPVTKHVVLKITYNSYYHENPETWDWNQLIESGADENVELIQVSDIPIVPQKLF